MASSAIAVKNTAYTFYVALRAQSSTKTFQSNPTLASGDVKVSIDGGSFANLTTLPTVTPASGKQVKVQMSSSEMNGDRIGVLFSDAAGAEWCDLFIEIATAARGVDDLAFPATSGRSIAVDASGNVAADVKLWKGSAPNDLTSGRVDGIVGAVASGAITSSGFAAGAITSTVIADNAITANKINSGAITSAKFAAGAVDSTALADGAITAAKFAAGAITSSVIATDAITSTGLAASAVAEIQAGLSTVTTAQVNAEVDAALADIHLDHLLETNTPSPLPGNAGSILHDLLEDDAGTWRFTANALENGPVGGGGGTDWTATEREQIRGALGIVGTQAAPAGGGQLQDIKTKTDGLNFTGTDVKATLDGETVTPAAGSITSSVFAAGAITAAAFATDAITSTVLAASAVTEIQAGLSTVTTAQVLAQAAQALVDIHLDHLLAVDTPAPLPGASGSIFKDMIEDDGGTWRWVANALETAPVDWSATEREQLRGALGIVGTQATPAGGGQLQAVKTKTDGLNFTGTDVKATLDGELVTPAAASITSSVFATGAVTAAALAAGAGNKIADHVLRRKAADVEASSDGDALHVDTLLGLVRAKFKSSISGSTWTIRKGDGTTLGTKTVTVTPGANPITAVTE